MSYVPENLKIILRPEQTCTVTVDGQKYSETIRSAFTIDADTDTRNALSWAKYGLGHNSDPNYQPDIIERANQPIEGLNIFSIDSRREGGRAYKVIDCDGYMYDLREDVFLESLYAGEVQGRLMTGDYIWVRNVTQMKLVRYGSEAYKAFMEAGKRRGLKKIKNCDLVSGGVYKSKQGVTKVFVGKYRGKGMLFVDAGGSKWKKAQDEYDELLAQAVTHAKGVGVWWRVGYQKAHSFVEQIGTVELGDVTSLIHSADVVVEATNGNR